MKLSALTLVMLSSVTLSTSAYASQSVSLAPKSSQLVQLPATSFAIEKQPVHFSQAVKMSASELQTDYGYKSVSDEYWIEVDGRSLNKGIGLNLLQTEALIRLSAKQSLGNKLPDNHAIDPQSLELIKDKKLIKKAFSQKVTQEQMATASILANSSAVKVASSAGTGKFQLRVGQALDPSQKYIVNVKEKNSVYRQSLSTNQQDYLAGSEAQFSATLAKSDKPLTNVSHHTFLKAPNGEMTQVQYALDGDHYRISLPQNMTDNARGQLYELHVQSQGMSGGNEVIRHGKIAFAVAQPTARMTIEGASFQRASVNLEVASEGRYAISGMIYGQDKSGQAQPIMQSSSAYYLSPGQQKVDLQFDQNILNASNLSKPYVLRDVKLMDQSRLSVLQRQPSQQHVMLEEPQAQSSGGTLSVVSLLGLVGLGALVRRRRQD